MADVRTLLFLKMRAQLTDILYLEDHDDTVELVTLVLSRNNYNPSDDFLAVWEFDGCCMRSLSDQKV